MRCKILFHGRIWCWEALDSLGEVYSKALNRGEGWFPFTGLDGVCSAHTQAAVQMVGEAPQAAFCFPCQNNGGCSPFGLCKYTGPGTRNCSCSWHSIGDGFTCRGKVHQVRGLCCTFCVPALQKTTPSLPEGEQILVSH